MKLPILLYHSISDQPNSKYRRWIVSPARFADQMAYLKSNGFNPLTITQLVSHLQSPSNGLPERPIAITFDDGLDDFLINALPVLVDNHFNATLYMPTGFAGKSNLWSGGPGDAGDRVMTWADLLEIEKQGVEVGSHSHTHRQMDTLENHEIWSEVTTSKDLLEQHLGHAVDSFAYPHGYHTAAICQMVAQAGYRSACAVKNALSSTSDNRFALARIVVYPELDVTRFGQLIDGRGLAPLSSKERVETKVWRLVRRSRELVRRSLGEDRRAEDQRSKILHG